MLKICWTCGETADTALKLRRDCSEKNSELKSYIDMYLFWARKNDIHKTPYFINAKYFLCLWNLIHFAEVSSA